jgi:hypothetical protein
MTAAEATAGIPAPRQPEAAPPEDAPPQEGAAERTVDAVFEEAMAHFAQMYEEWSTAVRAIRDA